MASILGPRDLLDIAVPLGVDAGEVFRFNLQDGMEATEVIQLAAIAIGTVNQQINERYGGMWYITEKLHARDRVGEGSRSMTPTAAEFTDEDGVRSDKVGHMLPKNEYKDATAWSRRLLELAARQDVIDDTQLIADRWQSRVDYDVLTRMLTNTENVMGTAGYDVPWAIGTGVNVPFIPPNWRAYSFDSSHTHFQVVNGAISATNAASMLNLMVQELRHHGHSGRLVAMVSDADVDTYRSMSKFVDLVPFNVVPGVSATSPVQVIQGEVQGIPGELFGYFNSKKGVVELRYHERIPTGYSFMTKSYGVNSPKNGLAVRVEQKRGFGLVADPLLTRNVNPKLDKIEFFAVHGIGVNDRLNGVAGFCNSSGSTWVNPTIS